MKKALGIIKTALVWLVVLLAVFMMIFTVLSVTTFNRNDRSLFGYKMYIVNTDSMAATDFAAGSLIMVKDVDPSTLKEGDIISIDCRVQLGPDGNICPGSYQSGIPSGGYCSNAGIGSGIDTGKFLRVILS